MKKFTQFAFACAALPFALLGCSSDSTSVGQADSTHAGQVVGLRRLTETQYRNSIADIFGPDITVAGRFEPVIRPTHELISTGDAAAALSPTGLEQFDKMARAIAVQVVDEAHRPTFVKCTPHDAKLPDDKCAESALTPIGRYVFRRPMTAAERQLYVKLANSAATQTKSFYTGLQLSLAAMLVSPNFLYVVETGEPDPSTPGQLRLDSYSRASRLSFLLWDTTPDETLLKAAEKGKLTAQADLDATAAKMASSTRFEDGVRAFFADMLVYEKFDDLSKDPVVFPAYNSNVAKALPEQMLRTIVGYLVNQSGDYRGLFTTRSSFITRELGPIYGVPVHSAKGWEPIEFSADSDRAGIVGQAAFLALYSQVGRSSATFRGRAVRELLLCQVVPDPPGNVDFKVVQETNNPVLRTARARLTAHASDAVCAGCHSLTDPVGLALERFDGIGAHRNQENGVEIDQAGKIDGQTYTGVTGLGEKIAANPAATSCVTTRAIEYATGHPARDAAKVATLEKAFAADGYRIKALFQQIASSPTFYQVPPQPVDQAKPRQTASIAN